MNSGMNRSAGLLCRAVTGFGPDLVETSRMPPPLAQHAAACLRCQAEVVRGRRLRRELGALAGRIDPAPTTLLANVERAVLADESPVAHQRQTGRVVATVAGATAAAAGVVVVAIWRRTRAAA